MTYGLPQDESKAGQDPIVPEGAEALLASRQPYLSAEQRRAVLYTTSIDSGYPLLDGTNGWGRLDLVTAADGYGAFLGDVAVEMDASQGGFNVQDWWRNDISGEGMLTKTGSGHLSLTGENTYTGGTLVQQGVLEARSAAAFGEGDLYVEGGGVLVDVEGALQLQGNLTIEGGTLDLQVEEQAAQVTIADTLYIDGGELKLGFSDFTPASGSTLTLLTASNLSGTFDSVDSEVAVELVYNNNSISAVVQ
ncbi:MAG: autotransporter-associated beta strand repeat-containing protein [Halopseudomonas sp.]|uniref:autotransporter-associated beta strand repeat-containing protein n=1 Tax=Halopseudomonas sp. TaxID=2901191 RepID=UPI003002A0DA